MLAKLERLDSYELRTALIWFKLMVICCAAFVISINWRGMDFAPFPIGMFILLALFEGCRWYMKAKYLYYADDEEGEEESEAEVQPVTPTTQPTTQQFAPLSGQMIRERAKLYAFVHGVTVNRAIGEDLWFARGLPKALYRRWITLLEDAGVVSSTAENPRRKVLMQFEQALAAIAQLVEEETGETGYWKPVEGYYNPARTPNSVLVMPDK
jgi:hypothetical protein